MNGIHMQGGAVTARCRRFLRLGSIIALLGPLLCLAAFCRAEPIRFEFAYTDPAGTGFNDPTAHGLRGAMEYAGSIWSRYLQAKYPGETIGVLAGFAPLATSVVAVAGAQAYYSASDKTQFGMMPNAIYGAPLYNHLLREDKLPGAGALGMELGINVNIFAIPFTPYWGLDGRPPPGTVDMVTVLVHEIGHGLGFESNLQSDGTFLNSTPSVYDQSLTTPKPGGGFSQLLDMTAAARLTAATSQTQLLWGGLHGVSRNGGVRPQLYAPSPWEGSSSVDHVNGTTPVPLMAASISPGEVKHAPTLAELGILEDLGWDLARTEFPTLLFDLAHTSDAVMIGCHIFDRCPFQLGKAQVGFDLGLDTGGSFRRIVLPAGFGDDHYRLTANGLDLGIDAVAGIPVDLTFLCSTLVSDAPPVGEAVYNCPRHIGIRGIEPGDGTRDFEVTLTFRGNWLGESGLEAQAVAAPGALGLALLGLGALILTRAAGRRPRGRVRGG